MNRSVSDERMIFRFQTRNFRQEVTPPPIMGGGCEHEHWSNSSFSTAGFSSTIRAQQVYQSLSGESANKDPQLLYAVRHHDFCTADFQRKLERHHHLLGRPERQIVSCRNPWGNRQKHACRRQREQELENLRGLRSSPYQTGTEAVFGREHRDRFCSNRVCLGLDDHRPLPLPFSLGKIPSDQRRNQAPYIVGFEGKHSKRRHCNTRKASRCEYPGSTGLRPWRVLRHGSRVSGLPKTLRDTSILRFLRNQSQAQLPTEKAKFELSGSNHRSAMRPSRGACRIQLSERISRCTEENKICGSGYKKAIFVPDQQFQPSRHLNCASIQIEMASGVVLQVDQAASPNKGILWNL